MCEEGCRGHCHCSTALSTHSRFLRNNRPVTNRVSRQPRNFSRQQIARAGSSEENGIVETCRVTRTTWKGMPKRAPGEFSCDNDDDDYVFKQLVKDFDGVSFLGQVVPRPAITLPRVTVTRRVRGFKHTVRPGERCRSWDG